jgi:dTDP-4-dehydrorhamnose reductase
VVVLGGSGLVGSRLLQLWANELTVIAPGHAELDILDRDALGAFMRQTDASLVVNFAAWTDVDGAEAERGDRNGRVHALNATHPTHLARVCRDLDRYLLHVSTDYVFDGASADRPYRETDTPHPLGWYAETKWLGEQGVLDSGARACVARIEMPFSAHHSRKLDVARTIVARLEAGRPFQGIVDQRITPVFVDDAARAFQWLVQAQHTGIVHVAAADWTTPYEFAKSIAERLKLNVDLVHPTEFAAFSSTRPAPRPRHSWLDVTRIQQLCGEPMLRSVAAELDAWVDQVSTSIKA